MIKRKPTPAMLEVLHKMANGWGLEHYPGSASDTYLRGPAGEFYKVAMGTHCGMLERGLIEWGEGYPKRVGRLTEAGREIAEAKP